MEGKQISSNTLSEQAYKAIKGFIIKNELLPGQAITINLMAKTLGTSQTPVREAILRLIADGFLIGEPYKRLRITEITEDDVHQIYMVRSLLEPHAAMLASAKNSINPEMRVILEKLFQQAQEIMRTPVERIEVEAYLEIDDKLNEIFILAAFPFFREVLRFVSDRSLRIRKFVDTLDHGLRKEVLYEITEEHLAIIQAILSGESEKSKACVLQHLKRGEARTLKTVCNFQDHKKQSNETPSVFENKIRGLPSETPI